MKHEYWESSWRAGRTGFHQSEVNGALKAFVENKMTNSGRCLVPLCGKSLDLFWLKDFFETVIGVEFVEAAVDAFAQEHGLAPAEHGAEIIAYKKAGLEIIQADFFAWMKLNHLPFDFIYDRAAMIALPKLKRKDYVDLIKKGLATKGEILLFTIEYKIDGRDTETVGPPFSVTEDEVRHLYGSHFEVLKLEETTAPSQSQKIVEAGGSMITQRNFLITHSS